MTGRVLGAIMLAAVLGALAAVAVRQIHPSPFGVTAPLHLFDPTGRMVIACTPGAVAGDAVCEHGKVIGAYVDDTTPHLDHWLAIAVAHYDFVIRAVAPGSPRPKDCRWLHVVCAKEWYPYESGFPVKAWGRMPRYPAYIVQFRFSLDGQPVKAWQTRTLEREARAMHPRFILLY